MIISLPMSLEKEAFQIVYKAKKGEEIVAIKQVSSDVLMNKNEYDQLQREIDSMAFLKHDHVLSLFDFFKENNNYYLVIEYCPGGNLLEFIYEGKITSDLQAAKIFYQIVDGLHYCHERGVAHRDLKSLNILMFNSEYIKICDFGFCAFFNENEKFKTFCGSPCYVSPECLQRIQYDSQKSDIWSLGVILYELLFGTQPWDTHNTPKMIKAITAGNYKIPKDVSAVQTELIKGLLKVNPNERLTLDKILANSWVKKGCVRKTSLSKSFSAIGPKTKLSILTSQIDRKDSDSDGGIVSPFLSIKHPSSSNKRERKRGNSFNSKSTDSLSILEDESPLANKRFRRNSDF